ncbi:MAG: hypothetical protein ACFE8L_00130 [Candidatus Hodarchaeota archaeon]
MMLNLKLEYYPKLSERLLKEAIEIIRKNKEKWDSPFFFDTKSYIDIDKIKTITEPFLSENIKNVIVLGTGGSIQTLLALKHLSKKKIYPVPSSRAVELKGCLEKTSPENSVVIPISRGGETLDINSTIGIFVRRGYKFLGISSMGTMNNILREIGCPILDVPDLSGRYAGSVTNVGIVPAYISGINIENFLKGLEEGYTNFSNYDDNPALELAAFLFDLYRKRYRVVFSMPYSKNLEGSVGLWVQGVSESTGKDERGMIGTYQSAPICQHSVLEFLLGGSKGIVIPTLWTVKNENPDLVLNSTIPFINEQSAQTIINYQADATFQALIQQRVPTAKVSIDNPSEKSMGHLISFILSSVYYLCLLIDVNWANNPKVNIGKQICNDALRDKIGPEQRERIRERLAKETWHS